MVVIVGACCVAGGVVSLPSVAPNLPALLGDCPPLMISSMRFLYFVDGVALWLLV